MGCWNETCMLSHMQIMSGDDVKVIILVNTDNKSNPCYHNVNYAPLVLPFDGEYDEYGGIITKNEYVPFYTDCVLENLDFRLKDESEYKYKTVEELISQIVSSDGLYVITNNICDRKPKKLECVYIHKELYDILVKDFKSRVPYNQTKDIYTLYTEKYEKIGKMLLRLKELHKKKDKDDFMESFDLKHKAIEAMFKPSQYNYNFNESYMHINDIYEIDHEKLLSDMVDYIMFAESLEFGRYGYLSRSGAGGQDADVRVQKLIAEFILRFSERTFDDDDNCKIYNEDETIYWYDNTED